MQVGEFRLPNAALGSPRGPVQIYYRPEEVLLGAPDTSDGASITALIGQIAPTRPLARVWMASDPPIAALLLHRDLEDLRLQIGRPIRVALPGDCVRIFPKIAW